MSEREQEYQKTARPMIVPTVGIHHGVPPDHYHLWDALSHSWMLKLRQSPAHLRDWIEHGADEPTADMSIGSAVHCYVLEPNAFAARYAVRAEGVSGATREGRAFTEQAEQQGKLVLSASDGRWIEAVGRRAKAHPRVREWLKREHETEVSLCWMREGYLCKARVDLMITGLNELIDLKTTLRGSTRGFAREVARLGYHTQAAWYLDGIQRLTGETWDWHFIVAEKRRPFLVSVQSMPRDSEAHSLAVTQNNNWFEVYKTCRESGLWPGYPDVTELVLPEWARETVEDTAEESFGE